VKIHLQTNEYENVPPESNLYEGGFDTVTQCKDCKRTTLCIDQYTSDPCTNCGGDVITLGVGKWDNSIQKWLIRVGKSDDDVQYTIRNITPKQKAIVSKFPQLDSTCDFEILDQQYKEKENVKQSLPLYKRLLIKLFK